MKCIVVPSKLISYLLVIKITTHLKSLYLGRYWFKKDVSRNFQSCACFHEVLLKYFKRHKQLCKLSSNITVRNHFTSLPVRNIRIGFAVVLRERDLFYFKKVWFEEIVLFSKFECRRRVAGQRQRGSMRRKGTGRR